MITEAVSLKESEFEFQQEPSESPKIADEIYSLHEPQVCCGKRQGTRDTNLEPALGDDQDLRCHCGSPGA